MAQQLAKEFVLREAKHLEACKAFLDWEWQVHALEGYPLVVEITPEKTKRSIQQNRRYFGGTLNQIETQAWVNGRQFSSDIWHQFFKRKFIGLVELPDGSTEGISSTGLSTKEFGEFIEQVEAYASQDLGVAFIAEAYL